MSVKLCYLIYAAIDTMRMDNYIDKAKNVKNLIGERASDLVVRPQPGATGGPIVDEEIRCETEM